MELKNLGTKLASLRKEKGLTQTELADKLYITHQAISQWENGATIPDVVSLLNLCEIFKVTLNDLFEQVNTTNLENDNKLRIVAVQNGKILENIEYLNSKVIVQINKDITGDVESHFDLTCNFIKGNVTAGGDIKANESIQSRDGQINAGGDISTNSITADVVNAGGDIDAKDSITANKVSAGGDIETEIITGSVSIGGDLNCQDITGNVEAGGDVTCDSIMGNVSGNIVKCNHIGGTVETKVSMYNEDDDEEDDENEEDEDAKDDDEDDSEEENNTKTMTIQMNGKTIKIF